MSTFELGFLRYGKKFTETTTRIAGIDQCLNWSFERICVHALWYLDGEEDTPLWFWR